MYILSKIYVNFILDSYESLIFPKKTGQNDTKKRLCDAFHILHETLLAASRADETLAFALRILADYAQR